MIPQLKEDLISRLQSGTPHRQNYADAIETIAAIGNKFDAEAAKINADRNLSSEGKRKSVSGVAVRIARDLLEASRIGRKAAEYAKKQRDAFKIPDIDPSDTVGEMRRAEFRQFLRELPDGKRTSVALEMAQDKFAAQAILHAHPLLSGVTNELRDRIMKQHLETEHGPAMQRVDLLDSDVACVKAAYEVTASEMANRAELTSLDFNQLLGQMQQEIDAR